MKQFKSHRLALKLVIQQLGFAQTMNYQGLVLSDADLKKAKDASKKIDEAIKILDEN